MVTVCISQMLPAQGTTSLHFVFELCSLTDTLASHFYISNLCKGVVPTFISCEHKLILNITVGLFLCYRLESLLGGSEVYHSYVKQATIRPLTHVQTKRCMVAA